MHASLLMLGLHLSIRLGPSHDVMKSMKEVDEWCKEIEEWQAAADVEIEKLVERKNVLVEQTRERVLAEKENETKQRTMEDVETQVMAALYAMPDYEALRVELHYLESYRQGVSMTMNRKDSFKSLQNDFQGLIAKAEYLLDGHKKLAKAFESSMWVVR